MTTLIKGSNGTNGVNGTLGADSTAVDQTSDDGGDGTKGSDAASASHVLTQADIDAGKTDVSVIGGTGGHGGDGNYAGQAFDLQDHVTNGNKATWHDTFSDAGNGGSGADGGDAGDGTLTARDLTVSGGLKLAAAGGLGGWGGNGFQGGQGGNTYFEHLSEWQVIDGVTISRDWTVDASAGGLSGHGGSSGDGGDGRVSLSHSTVHGNVSIMAQGQFSDLAGSGGAGTGGTSPSTGADGGDSGDGGDAKVVVDSTNFDFNSTIAFLAQSGSGSTGGSGGYGGYSNVSTRNDDIIDNNYTFAKGGDGGDGGNAGNVDVAITHSNFIGTAGNDTLNLSLHLTTGSRGDGGRGGLGGLEPNDAYKGRDGDAGQSATLHFVFDGNTIDGGAGIDTFKLDLFNQTFERSTDGSGLTDLGTITIDLEHGTMQLGEGIGTIQNVENIDLNYVNTYMDVSSRGYYSGNAVVIGDDHDNAIKGTFGNDSLSGGGGDDVLNGVGGHDVLYGGGGNDTYYTYAGQTILEFADGGIDTEIATGTTTLADNVENLTLLLNGNRFGTGNELNNVLTGNGGDNRLGGRDGNDILIGGHGNDLMLGGAGNDVAYVTEVGDVMREYAGQGFDVVKATVDVKLGNNVEELIMLGGASLHGQGSSGDNRLFGNRGNNWLNGGGGDDVLDGMAGTDKLAGGHGADTFRFSLGSGHDTIRDFSAAENDHINVHAYSGGVAFGGNISLSQDGSDTIIDFGGGNNVRVLNVNANDQGLLNHIIW